MGQQEYEAFKAKLREWMDTHLEEYAAFEEAMNARDYAGCQSVIFQAMSLIPWYRRLMSDKKPMKDCSSMSMRSNRRPDNTTLPARSSGSANSPARIPRFPAMLCWLYFGKSFERMVERCAAAPPDLGFLQKMTMSATIRLLISRSIKLELRTKQDWDAHREAMRLAESDRVLEWARALFRPKMRVKRGNPAGRVRPNHWWTCFHRLSHPDVLRQKIGEYITKRHTRPTSHV